MAWNREHDQQAPCKRCGHPYERHFDGYEDNAPVGCKYCRCPHFVEADGTFIVDTPIVEELRKAKEEERRFECHVPLIALLEELQQRRTAHSVGALPESCPHTGHETPKGCDCAPDCYCVTRTCKDTPYVTSYQWLGDLIADGDE